MKYGSTIVQGQMLTKEQTATEPTVQIPPGHYVVMYDPDAVKPDYIHWISGVLPYQGPAPPPGTGIHHYKFVMCKGVPPQAPAERGGQRAEPFLRNPVDTVFFTVAA